MLQVKTKESFEIVLNNIADKGSFVIHTRGARRIVYLENKPIVIYHKNITKEIEEKRIESKKIMTEVRISVTSYIKRHFTTGIPVISQNCSVIYSKKYIWDSLPAGTEFYLIDAKHCYWRIAYILGYISKRVYSKYCDNEDMKTLRNISLSILNSDIRREYYENGEKINEIFCDVSAYQQIYKNIRHYTYNNSGEIKDTIPDYCIAYRVDGVYLLKPGLKKAKQIFEKNQLLYKIKKCIKVDEKNYSNEDGELKKLF